MQKISNSSKTKVTFFDEVDIDPVQLLSVCPVLGYPAFMNFCWKIVLSTTFFFAKCNEMAVEGEENLMIYYISLALIY